MQRMTVPEVLEMLATIFEVPAGSLSPDTLRAAIPGWDSFGALALMAELDDRFGILLEEDDMQKFIRVDDVLAVLRKHGALVPAAGPEAGACVEA